MVFIHDYNSFFVFFSEIVKHLHVNAKIQLWKTQHTFTISTYAWNKKTEITTITWKMQANSIWARNDFNRLRITFNGMVKTDNGINHISGYYWLVFQFIAFILWTQFFFSLAQVWNT